ncbi:MAG: hypothetical protein WA160_02400 [Pseudobdellovibrio sp.]
MKWRSILRVPLIHLFFKFQSEQKAHSNLQSHSKPRAIFPQIEPRIDQDEWHLKYSLSE